MEKILVNCLRGLEEECISEIKEILEVKGRKAADGRVLFRSDELKKYLRKARTVYRVCRFVKNFKFKKKEDILKEIKRVKFDFNGSFRVKCNREGKHDFKSVDVEKEAGIIIGDGKKVDFKNPKNVIFVDLVDNGCFLGYLVKEKMQKRDYRFKRNNDSIDACLSASLRYFGNVGKKELVVNPLCKDCVIGIEMFLQGVKKIYCFDGYPNNIRNAKINIKLAKAKIELSNRNVGWMSTMFKERSVDKIIAIFPYSSRKEDILKKDFKELFNQAGTVLKKDGKIIIVGRRISVLKDIMKDFKVEKTKEVFVGKEKYGMGVLGL